MAEFINTADVIGDDEMCDQIIQRTVTEYKENRISTVGKYAFDGCSALTTVDLPNVTVIESSAFAGTNIDSLNLPEVTEIKGNAFDWAPPKGRLYLPKLIKTTGGYTFRGTDTREGITELDLPSCIELSGGRDFCNCFDLASVNLPVCKSIGYESFGKWSGGKSRSTLTVMDLPACTNIGAYAFNNMLVSMKFLVLRSNSICTLGGTTAFDGTPIASGTGHIYVPRTLLNSYKTATNWSTYAAQFRAIEDYTVDGTVTGELDESKI